MGFLKDVKADSAKLTASRAVTEGRTVFLYRFNVPASSPAMSGPLSGAAEVIEAVEAAGWRLSDMAYDGAQSKNGAMLLLFRRR
jgi:hypothetical protein